MRDPNTPPNEKSLLKVFEVNKTKLSTERYSELEEKILSLKDASEEELSKLNSELFSMTAELTNSKEFSEELGDYVNLLAGKHKL